MAKNSLFSGEETMTIAKEGNSKHCLTGTRNFEQQQQHRERKTAMVAATSSSQKLH